MCHSLYPDAIARAIASMFWFLILTVFVLSVVHQAVVAADVADGAGVISHLWCDNLVVDEKSPNLPEPITALAILGGLLLKTKGVVAVAKVAKSAHIAHHAALHAGTIANYATAHASTIATITGGVAVGVILGEIAELLAKAVVAKKMSEQEAKTSFEKAKTLSPEGQKRFREKLRNLLDEDFD